MSLLNNNNKSEFNAAVVKFSIATGKLMNIVDIVDNCQDSPNLFGYEIYDNLMALVGKKDVENIDEFKNVVEEAENICKDNAFALLYFSKKFSFYLDYELFKECRKEFCSFIKNGDGCEYSLICCQTMGVNTPKSEKIHSLIEKLYRNLN